MLYSLTGPRAIHPATRFSNTSTTLLTNSPGIVDTGTTLLLLPQTAINTYQRATGAVEDETTGLLRLTTTQFSDLESLTFTIGGVST